LKHGRCYVAESSSVALALTVSRDGNTVTVAAEVTGAPEAKISLITDSGCAGRAKTDQSGVGRLTWTDSGGVARFARIEVRRRSRFPSMVAMSNPVWLDSTV
ncbi:MAG TPA: hypothetical protein VF328_13985, partial [Mycobacterium sp.]